MVSLDNGRRDASLEGRSQFSDEVVLTTEEEELYGHCSANIDQPTFHRVHTVWVAALLLLFLVILEILTFVIPWNCHNNHCFMSEISTTILLQTSFWGLVLIIDQFYRKHHRHLRQLGYLRFYRETRVLKRATLFIFSVGNAVLLLCLLALRERCPQDDSCLTSINLHPVNVVQALLTFEVLLSFPFVILYIVKIVKFNKHQSPPDIHQEDLIISYSNICIPETEIGYRCEDTTNEVIEKQGDYIRYLKQHNANLGRKLLVLASELRALKSV